MMRDYQQSSLFFGANAPYIEELYEQYLADPASVPENWRKQFDSLLHINFFLCYKLLSLSARIKYLSVNE